MGIQKGKNLEGGDQPAVIGRPLSNILKMSRIVAVEQARPVGFRPRYKVLREINRGDPVVKESGVGVRWEYGSGPCDWV